MSWAACPVWCSTHLIRSFHPLSDHPATARKIHFQKTSSTYLCSLWSSCSLSTASWCWVVALRCLETTLWHCLPWSLENQTEIFCSWTWVSYHPARVSSQIYNSSPCFAWFWSLCSIAGRSEGCGPQVLHSVWHLNSLPHLMKEGANPRLLCLIHGTC